MKKHRYLLALLSLYLGLYNGRLAIWKDTEAQPLHVFPYSVQVYPEADQTALKQGIPFSTQKELSGLLEDYLS